MHNSVFLREAVDALSIKKDGKYIDATYGVGGHTAEIIRRGGRVLAIDLDPSVSSDQSATRHIVQGNFSNIKEIAEKKKQLEEIDEQKRKDVGLLIEGCKVMSDDMLKIAKEWEGTLMDGLDKNEKWEY